MGAFGVGWGGGGGDNVATFLNRYFPFRKKEYLDLFLLFRKSCGGFGRKGYEIFLLKGVLAFFYVCPRSLSLHVLVRFSQCFVVSLFNAIFYLSPFPIINPSVGASLFCFFFFFLFDQCMLGKLTVGMSLCSIFFLVNVLLQYIFFCSSSISFIFLLAHQSMLFFFAVKSMCLPLSFEYPITSRFFSLCICLFIFTTFCPK